MINNNNFIYAKKYAREIITHLQVTRQINTQLERSGTVFRIQKLAFKSRRKNYFIPVSSKH